MVAADRVDDDPLFELAASYEDRISAAVSAAFEATDAAADWETVAARLEDGAQAPVQTALGINGESVPALAASLTSASSTYVALIALLIGAAGSLSARQYRLVFDASGPEPRAWKSDLTTDLSSQLSRQAAAALRNTLTATQGGRYTAERTVKLLRQTLALTPAQARSLVAFEAVLHDALQAPSPIRVRLPGRNTYETPATRSARLRNFALNASQRAVLRKALAGDLSASKVDALVFRQAKSLAAVRATAIGRQQAAAAAHAGEHAALKQAVRIGRLPATTRRFWTTAGDERVRHSHAAIPGMNSHGVAPDEPFTTPLGVVMFPPLEVNCRCRVVLSSSPGNYSNA